MLAGMATLLRHRGPDSDGFFQSPGVGLAFRRLSIIDLAGGDQPIANEDGTVTLVCNGEIYNFVELRADLEARGHRFRSKSDVEVIVHLYEEHGPDCLRFLRGMFAFALWDARERRLMLARDRFGIKPLFYAETPHGLYFGSEQKPILAFAEDLDRTPDPEAYKWMLFFGYALGARTPCRGIRSLPCGRYLLYRDGESVTHRYWSQDFPARGDARPSLSDDDWAEALLEKLRETVRLHMRSDVPVGAWLSPGIDSSAAAVLASELTDEPILGFTLGFDDPEADELRHSPILDHYGDYGLQCEIVRYGKPTAELFERAVWHSEEPADIAMPRLLLAEATARRAKVVMSGEGSDEVFGGYSYFRRQAGVGRLSHLPLWVRRLLLRAGPYLSQRFNDPQVRELLMLPPVMDMQRFAVLYNVVSNHRRFELLSPALRAEVSDSLPEPPIPMPAAFGDWSSFHQQLFLEQTVRLPEHITMELDRPSMACGVEARVPFLDHELVEFCAGMPVDLKLRGDTEKYILRRALRGLLPPEILERRKRGLRAPAATWWRQDPLPDFAQSLLSEAELRRVGLFDPPAVHALIASHRRGEANYSRPLDALLTMQKRDALFQPSRLVAQAKAMAPQPAPAL